MNDYYLQERVLKLPSGLELRVKEVSLLHLLEICSELDINIDDISNNPKSWQTPKFISELLKHYVLDEIDIYKLKTKDLLYLITEASKSFQDTELEA